MSVFAAAREYEKLLNTEYVLTVRKNRNSNPQVIRLRFDKSDFHHICGLHKLATAPQLRTEASQAVFEKIISRVYEDQMFEKDPDYSKIEGRIALITDLVSFLESDNTVLKINWNSPVRFSKIDADFVKSFDGSDVYHPCSCFKQSLKDRDITQGDIKLHIIKKGGMRSKRQSSLKHLRLARTMRLAAMSWNEYTHKSPRLPLLMGFSVARLLVLI